VRKSLIVPTLIIGGLLGAVVVPSLAARPLADSASAAEVSTVFNFGGTWSHKRSTNSSSTWQSDTGWAAHKAPFGFGSGTGTVTTTLRNDFSPRPLATYFKKSFSLSSVPQAGLTLETWADDGIIVYVNGTEVTRKNLPTGTIGFTTYATKAPSSKAARASHFTAAIPASVLKTGKNQVAVQVQSNWRNTTNSTFDAKLTTAVATTPPTNPPVTPPTTPPTSPPTTNPPTTPPATDSGYVEGWGTPAWRDEFTYVDPATGKPAVDPTKWNVRSRSDLGLLPDAAIPTASQVSVDTSGVAHLKADWLATPETRSSGPTLTHKTGYMDQRVIKSGDVSYGQRYGRWEIRAQVPTGPHTYGALAAFWLRNANSGEIDIMESWGYNETGINGQRLGSATTSVHTQTSGSGNVSYRWDHIQNGAPKDLWKEFHTWAFELTPTYASIFVDGKKLATATPATHPNLWNTSYFNSPLAVRLNLHVGASTQYYGMPDVNHKDWTQNLDYKVDYVRIWPYKG